MDLNQHPELNDSDLTAEERVVAHRLSSLQTLKPSTTFRRMTRMRLEQHIADAQAVYSCTHKSDLLPAERALADNIATLHNLTPSATYRRTFRARLQMHMAEQPIVHLHNGQNIQPAPMRSRTIPSFAAQLATAAFAILFILLVGTGLATANSMPGDNLYQIKRSFEDIQVSLSTQEQKPAINLLLTERRLGELQHLLKHAANEKQVRAAADEYNKSIEQTLDTVDATTDPDVAAQAAHILETHREVIETLSREAPSEVQPALKQIQESNKNAKSQVERKLPPSTSINTPIAKLIATQTREPTRIPSVQSVQSRPTINILLPLIGKPHVVHQSTPTTAQQHTADKTQLSSTLSPTKTLAHAHQATSVPTVSASPTDTAMPTRTDTATPTRTDTAMPTRTDTAMPTRTDTATPTRTDTATPTRTDTATPTRTDTATPTVVVMPTVTATATPQLIATIVLTKPSVLTPSPIITTTAVMTTTPHASVTPTPIMTNTVGITPTTVLTDTAPITPTTNDQRNDATDDGDTVDDNADTDTMDQSIPTETNTMSDTNQIDNENDAPNTPQLTHEVTTTETIESAIEDNTPKPQTMTEMTPTREATPIPPHVTVIPRTDSILTP